VTARAEGEGHRMKEGREEREESKIKVKREKKGGIKK
jgi:hypothetical protein